MILTSDPKSFQWREAHHEARELTNSELREVLKDLNERRLVMKQLDKQDGGLRVVSLNYWQKVLVHQLTVRVQEGRL